MSVKIMAAVFESTTLGPTERLVMLALADHADDAGRCYPAMGRLCQRTGLSDRAIQKNVKALVEAGYLTVAQNAGQGGANVYIVHPTPEPRSPRNDVHPRTTFTTPPNVVRQTPERRSDKPSGTIREEEANASLSSGDDKRDEAREALAMFNAMAAECGWPQVRILSPARRSALAARLRECGGIAGWDHALAKARASPHCNGQNDRGWVANFDFLTRQSSFAKLMEGNYDDRAFRQPADRPQNRPDPALDQIARLAGLGQAPGYDRH